MSRSSFPSFHLNDKNQKPVSQMSASTTNITNKPGPMNSSVDKLFENESDVFMSSHFIDFQALPCIHESGSEGRVQDINPSGVSKTTEIVLEEVNERDSPSTSTAKSSRRDSLNEKILLAASTTEPSLPVLRNGNVAASNGGTGELLEKFQRQKHAHAQNTSMIDFSSKQQLQLHHDMNKGGGGGGIPLMANQNVVDGNNVSTKRYFFVFHLP